MNILIITASVVGAVWLFYSIVAMFSKRSILKSSLATEAELIKSDMVYYLPRASVQLNATAKITVITELGSNNVPKNTTGKLSELAVVPEVAILPDTSFLFTLNHIGNCFMNDEYRLTCNASGLLDTVSATTEDRIGAMLGTIAEAPSKIFQVQPMIAEAPVEDGKTFTTETKVFTKSFFITLEDIKKGEAECVWQINVDGTVTKAEDAIANFKVIFKGAPAKEGLGKDQIVKIISDNANKEEQDDKTLIKGLVSRPLITIGLEMTPTATKATNKKTVFASIQIPDPSRLINIPVRRALFVKSVNTPKFSNGMLVENYMNRPSGFEGFLNIPINLAKALVSIPAQLFNFKIQHQYQNEIASLNMQKKLNELKKQAGDAPKKP